MLEQIVLDAVIQRVVDVAHPERITLYGSAAQGRMSRNSDVDLLIIKDGSNPISLMASIYDGCMGLESPSMQSSPAPKTLSATRTHTHLYSSLRCAKGE